MVLEKTIYVGPFVHCISLQELEICPDAAIGVDEAGKIAFIDRESDGSSPSAKEEWKEAKVVKIPDNGFFFPGFIGM